MAEKLISYQETVDAKSVEGTHEFADYGSFLLLACYTSDTENIKYATSTFSFPSFTIKSGTVNSLKFSPITKSGNAASTLFLKFDNKSYQVNEDGTVNDEVISHLNSYKSRTEKYPDIICQLDSWAKKPEPDSNVTLSYTSIGLNVFIELKIQGGSLILRPNADVSVGHEIMPGFTGVYQLIDEDVADDEGTQIGTRAYISSDNEDKKTQTSIVSLNGGAFSKKKILLMKLVSCHCIEVDESDTGVRLTVMFGGENASFSSSSDTGEAYKTNEWFITASSSITSSINLFVKNNKVLPEIHLQLETTAHAFSSSNKSDDASAYITQAYIEVFYEDILDIGVSKKINGEYKAASTAYKKQSGTWSEIPEDEAKTILKNNTIRRG